MCCYKSATGQKGGFFSSIMCCSGPIQQSPNVSFIVHTKKTVTRDDQTIFSDKVGMNIDTLIKFEVKHRALMKINCDKILLHEDVEDNDGSERTLSNSQ